MARVSGIMTLLIVHVRSTRFRSERHLSTTGKEQFANDYINSNTDHTRWAQNLFRELLGDRDYSGFDCTTTGARCVTPGDVCGTQTRPDVPDLLRRY